jgi:hypothetical protein
MRSVHRVCTGCAPDVHRRSAGGREGEWLTGGWVAVSQVSAEVRTEPGRTSGAWSGRCGGRGCSAGLGEWGGVSGAGRWWD